MSATALVEVAPAAEFELPYDGQLQTTARAVPARRLDAVSRAWWVRLHETGPVRDCAIVELHECLRREAWFHIRLRTRGMSEFPGSDLDDLAVMAADDALLAVLRKLEDYRGESQFWTWARRFAQLEAPVSIRRRMGHDHVTSDPEQAFAIPDPGCSLQERVEIQELLREVSDLIVDKLTYTPASRSDCGRDRRHLGCDARDRVRHHSRGYLQDDARRPQEADRATSACAECQCECQARVGLGCVASSIDEVRTRATKDAREAWVRGRPGSMESHSSICSHLSHVRRPHDRPPADQCRSDREPSA